MTDAPQVLLAYHLKTLKLPTFLREYEKLARQCAAEGTDHVRYLIRLAELELIDRERRMVERRIPPMDLWDSHIDSILRDNDADDLCGELVPADGHGFWSRWLVVAIPAAEPGGDPG